MILTYKQCLKSAVPHNKDWTEFYDDRWWRRVPWDNKMTAFSIPQIGNPQMKLQRLLGNKSRNTQTNTHLYTHTCTKIHTYIHTLWNWLLIPVRKGILSLSQIGLNHNIEEWNIGISIFVNYIYFLTGGKLLLQWYVCFCHTTTWISNKCTYISIPSWAFPQHPIIPPL